MPNPAPTATWQSLRMLSLTLAGAPVVILVALATILGPQERAFEPPLWALAAPLALAVVALALVSAVGYRTAAIDPTVPTEEARTTAAARFQSLTILRFTLVDAVFIVSIALAFVVDHGGLAVTVVGAALSEVLIWMHVVPNPAQLQKVQAALGARGAAVSLREALQAP
ncbi:hypothetical protein [Nocardioides jiangxiensis]|uniref:Uncharacterized protein n=1 Tax=Nocardioides jiangxiensis TaxID=3064524 RepID=A0ABT9B272_9ACTN|nr:hypothetical protein [Nocardioides sp. WY-20]MDO7867722.1 hypothetical protein [Nocardioides sp. WY-20]